LPLFIRCGYRCCFSFMFQFLLDLGTVVASVLL
jgi:hypothetical protein